MASSLINATSGYNLGNAQRILDMQQAMALQQLGALGQMPGPGQIGVQSLEDDFYTLTFGNREYKLLNDIHVTAANNWIHQYNTLNNYGSNVPAAVGAAALPPVNNSFFDRGWVTIKFFLDLRQIPQQLLEIESAVGPLPAEQARDSLMSLTAKVAHAHYWANSAINPFEFDGVYTQLKNSSYATTNIIDMRNQPLSPTQVETAVMIVRSNFSDMANIKMYGSPAAIVPFTLNYVTNERAIPAFWNGLAGNPFSGWDAQFAETLFRDDRFSERTFLMNQGGKPTQSQSYVPQNAPSPPTQAPVLTVNNTDSASQFNSQTPGGRFAYCYEWLGPWGNTLASPIATTTVPNGGSVSLAIPITANPTPGGVRIYRSGALATGQVPAYSNLQFMVDVPVGTSVGTLDYTDENSDIPGTYTVFILNLNKAALHTARLGDVKRFEFAPVNMAYWFATAWYGALVMPNPAWHVAIKNVQGQAIPSTFVTPFYS
jgi:hypothetical protein